MAKLPSISMLFRLRSKGPMYSCSLYSETSECKGVSHVPHALAGEDIAGRFQQTKVLGIKVVHFRLVLDVVGEPLTKCISTHQFAQIISDALQGTVNHPLS